MNKKVVREVGQSELSPFTTYYLQGSMAEALPNPSLLDYSCLALLCIGCKIALDEPESGPALQSW